MVARLTRVEQVRQDAAKAREALAEAVAAQEKEEGFLADGERLEQLLATPSPSTAPQVPVIPSFGRGQPVASHDRQFAEEISQLRVGVVRSTAMDEDDDNAVADLPHKKSRVSPVTPLAVTGGSAPQTLPAITGGHRQGSTNSR